MLLVGSQAALVELVFEVWPIDKMQFLARDGHQLFKHKHIIGHVTARLFTSFTARLFTSLSLRVSSRLEHLSLVDEVICSQANTHQVQSGSMFCALALAKVM